eukprot:GHVT01021337.1.p2 GENE.GHVT01021337.1~~GHVT01021337.1.p2  ORF type:complete len:100 (-),score=15.53 GHVT01021337.1:175-474(-)
MQTNACDRQHFVVQEINHILETIMMVGQRFGSVQEDMTLATSEQRQNTELLQLKIREQEDELTAKEDELTRKNDELTGKIDKLSEKETQLQEQSTQLTE